MLKAAGALSWVLGLGFGLLCPYAIWYFADRGEVWTFLGFPTYGEGPFEHIGIGTTVPLLVLFLLVCAAEVAAGLASTVTGCHRPATTPLNTYRAVTHR